MSYSIISKLVINRAGHLAGRSKLHQLIGLQTSLSYYSSYGRSYMLSANIWSVPLQHPSTFLGIRQGHKPYETMESLSCRLVSTIQYADTWPSTSSTKPSRCPTRFPSYSLNTFNVSNVEHSLLPGFSVAHQVRFISSQRRSSKNSEVLNRKEPHNLGKTLRNSRRNSEKAGDRQLTKESDGKASLPENPDEEEEKKLTLYQRFKKTYKEHGKVLVAVHVATSLVWFGTFYTAASLGFDIVPLLESWNLSERVISPFRSGGLGNVALAYLLYKLATPARYTVTITGTKFAIGYLQKEGKMKVVPQADSLRSLYKEGKEDIKGRSKKRISIMRRKARARRKQRSSSEEISDKS